MLSSNNSVGMGIQQYINSQPRNYQWPLNYIYWCPFFCYGLSAGILYLHLLHDPTGRLIAWLHPGQSTIYVVSEYFIIRLISITLMCEFLARFSALPYAKRVMIQCKSQADWVLSKTGFGYWTKQGIVAYIIAVLSFAGLLLSYSSCYYFTDRAMIHTSIVPSWNWKIPYKQICSAYVHAGWHKCPPGDGGPVFRADCNFYLCDGRRIHLSEYNFVLNKWTDVTEPTRYVANKIGFNQELQERIQYQNALKILRERMRPYEKNRKRDQR